MAAKSPQRQPDKVSPISKGPAIKKINLALQGGGAHGAFTWGVLDYLLEDPRVVIDGISGTSAGAINAALVCCGLEKNGQNGARQSLQAFWKAVSLVGLFSWMKRSPVDFFQGHWGMDHSPSYLFWDLLSRTFSPYNWNPLDLNPLKGLLEAQIDFSLLHQSDAIQLFVSATNIRTGRSTIFTNPQITSELLLASACLPYIYQSQQVGTQHYWDGGFIGNPSLYPLFKCESNEVVIVQINPLFRDEIPTAARDIINRMDEISFNASLLHELRAIEFVTRLLNREAIPETEYKRMLIHRIEADHILKNLGASSKYNTEWDFLTYLQGVGRDAARQWLNTHYDTLGVQSTVDIRSTYLQSIH